MRLSRRAQLLQGVDMAVPMTIVAVAVGMEEVADTAAVEEEEAMVVDTEEGGDMMIDMVDNHPRPTTIVMADTLAVDMEAAATVGGVEVADTVATMIVLPTVVEVSDMYTYSLLILHFILGWRISDDNFFLHRFSFYSHPYSFLQDMVATVDIRIHPMMIVMVVEAMIGTKCFTFPVSHQGHEYGKEGCIDLKDNDLVGKKEIVIHINTF
jgi:hypothetical protein